MCENFDLLDGTEAKAAMIWILGDYAEKIDRVEDIMSTFLDDFMDEPVQVQLQILTAMVSSTADIDGDGERFGNQGKIKSS
jgi:vesicle coat complex subunit